MFLTKAIKLELNFLTSPFLIIYEINYTQDSYVDKNVSNENTHINVAFVYWLLIHLHFLKVYKNYIFYPWVNLP